MYRVVLGGKTEKQIDRHPPRIRERVLRALTQLRDDPRPDGVRKMKGFERRYRVRIGDY